MFSQPKSTRARKHITIHQSITFASERVPLEYEFDRFILLVWFDFMHQASGHYFLFQFGPGSFALEIFFY